MASPLLVITSSLILLYIIIDRILTYRRLSHIPGPRFAPFSRIPHVLIAAGGYQSHKCLELSRKYGPLCRIGPNHVLTSSTELLRRMNAPRSSYRRSAWYQALRFKPRTDNMFSTRDEARHAELRKIMKAGYDGKENERLELEIEAGIAGYVDLIEREYVYASGKGRPMDFAVTAQYWSMDTMGRLAFGYDIGDCESNSDNFGFMRAVQEAAPMMVGLASFPDIHTWLEKSRIVDLVAPSAKDNMGLGKVVAIIESKVAERFGPEAKDVKDMLGSFVRHGLKREEANSEAVLLTLAGSDTTATSLRAIMLHLIGNPPALSRLRREIDEGIQSGKLSIPAKEAEIRTLSYLQACITEGLRIWPPAVAFVEKTVPSQGDTLNDVHLPGGTLISSSVWAMCRDTTVFGNDADIYRPERWLDAKGEELRSMSESADLVFGSGRFECAGKRVALIELRKVFVELLRRYEFQIVNPDKPWEWRNYGIFAQKNMWVRVTHRT